MKIGSLFSGYGGLDLGVQAALGGEVVWHVENDPRCAQILARHWPGVPNHGDISAVDWTAVEPVDVLAGGFPCQDISAAGLRAGLGGARSGLWSQMAVAVERLRPALVVIENVRGLLYAQATSALEYCPWCMGNGHDRVALRALGTVLGDLADRRYDARWRGVRACDVGAPHERFRVFAIATDAELGRRQGRAWRAPRRRAQPTYESHATADADGAGLERYGRLYAEGESAPKGASARRKALDWGEYAAAVERWERVTGRVAPSPVERSPLGTSRLSPLFVEWMQGLARGHVTDAPIGRNAQLAVLGNGVVPQQAAAAIGQLCNEVAA